MSLVTTNTAAWRRSVKTALADLELDSEEQVVDLAREMSKAMRAGAPEMDPAERRQRQQTERTRKATRKRAAKTTIRFWRRRDERGFYVDVGASKGAFNLAFYEYGTSRQMARPFLRPAIERAISGWRR